MAPRWAQDGTRMVKEAMLSQVGVRKVSERESIEKTNENNVFWSVVRWLLGGQGGQKTPQDVAKTPPRRARMRHDGPRCLQDAPKMPQDAAKRPQDAAKRLPRGAQEANLARKIEKK